MLCEFIHKGDLNHNLIVIFAGWSTDATFYSHVKIDGWDTLVVSGYSNLDFPEEILEGYDNIALFAWSLGVYASSRCFPFSKACMAVAVNGTEHPVNDSLGIPEKIFTGTSSTLNERNLTKFRRRMAADSFTGIADKFPEIPIAELQAQLNFIHKDYKRNQTDYASRWNRVYVSRNDLIFPPQAQAKAWEIHPSNPQVIKVDAPHYLDLFPIIRAAIPQHNIIGKRFHKALPTYNEFASPQETIAENLINLLNNENNENNENTDNIDNILEIGPGTGFMTHRIAERFHPSSVDFVDLFETDPFNVAPTEKYFIADAEAWIKDITLSSQAIYDAVVSASAIQWFINPAEFFRNAAKVLKHGGILLCSTFLPGNLQELYDVNPYGLVYHSAEELKNYLSDSFSKVVIKDEIITINFNTPRDTLSHLIHTGVGGSARSSTPLSNLLQRLPSSLTYHPLYILAIK